MLITGGAGFIGSHAAEFFSRDRHVEVCDNLSRNNLFRTKFNDKYNWNFLRRTGRKIDLHKTDIRNFKLLKQAAKSASAIIHAAGQVAVTRSLADPRDDFEVNALGTLNILELARLNDSAVVFCSTNKVYGENVNKIPVREEPRRYVFANSEFRRGIPENFSIDHTGHSPYGSSKLAADTYVQDYAHTYGLKTGVFRMSCIYGERQFGVEEQGWLAWFVIASLTQKPITIYGNGKQVRDVLYVKDLIRAFDAFLHSNIKHGVFNMGGGPSNTLSLLELLDLIEKTSGQNAHLRYEDWRPADQKVYISDVRKAQESLGWKPTVSPIEGLAHVTKWVDANRNLLG